MPTQLRVKEFVISTDDIKLDRGIMTSTIEIEKFDPDLKRRRANAYDDEDDYAGMQTDIALSENDVSHVIRQRSGPSRKIEIFSGTDPMFNCKNLKLRLQEISRKDIILLSIGVFFFILAITSVILWFKIFLNGYAN